MNQNDKDVHTEHCCKWHGCKYGQESCPVDMGRKEQSFPCEFCDDEYGEYLRYGNIDPQWVRFMENSRLRY